MPAPTPEGSQKPLLCQLSHGSRFCDPFGVDGVLSAIDPGCAARPGANFCDASGVDLRAEVYGVKSPAAPRMRSLGFSIVTVVCGPTDSVSHTLDPTTESCPMTVAPPSTVALA